MHGVTANLGELEVPGAAEMALQLFLNATPASSEAAGLELITYDFFEQVGAFSYYSSLFTDQRMLSSVIGGLPLGYPCKIHQFRLRPSYQPLRHTGAI